jgi:uncharacterized protein with GYD domain
MEEKNRMTEYLVLLKLSPSKILDAIEDLRKIPKDGIQGVDTYYTMNIFGTWDVGVWFNATNTKIAMDCVHKNLTAVSGVTDSYILPMFPSKNNGMVEYMVLLKLSPKKQLDAIEDLRKIPKDGIQGVDTYYTMNIFGTWDVGVWFNAENATIAMDFVHNTLREVSGVVDSYTLPMFPQYHTVNKTEKKIDSKPEKVHEDQKKIVLEATH